MRFSFTCCVTFQISSSNGCSCSTVCHHFESFWFGAVLAISTDSHERELSTELVGDDAICTELLQSR